MIETLFPIGENWSWGTFALYLIVTLLVTFLCKCAARCAARELKPEKGQIVLKNSNILYFVAYLILVSLATLRTTETGPDTASYVKDFLLFDNISFSWEKLFSFNQTEPGFQLYLFLVRKITDNYTILFLITYGMIAASYIKFIKRFWKADSQYIFLEIFIFYYVSNMSGMRAALAMPFLFASMYAIVDKKYVKAVVFSLLAACFHYTMLFNVILCAVVIVLRSNLLKRKKIAFPLLLIASTIVTSFSLSSLGDLLSNTKYAYYKTDINELSFLGSIFLVIFAVLCFIYFSRIKKDENSETTGLFDISLSMLILYPAIFLTAAYRIPNYYIMPRLCIWCTFEKNMRRKITPNEKLVFDICVQIIVILYLLFRFTRSSEDGAFVYHLIELI